MLRDEEKRKFMESQRLLLMTFFFIGSLVLNPTHAFPSDPEQGQSSAASSVQQLQQTTSLMSAEIQDGQGDSLELAPLSRADVLYREGNFKKSAKLLKSFLSGPVSEDSAEAALFLLADCQYQLIAENPKLNMQVALNGYLSASRSYPKSLMIPKATYRMAEIHLRQKMYKRAIYLFEKTIKEYPESPYVAHCTFSLAKILIEKGEDAQGLRMIRKVFAGYPGSNVAVEARIYLIAYYDEKEKFAKAISQYDSIPEKVVSESPDLKNTYADLLLKLKRYDEARDFLFKQVNLYPDDPFAPRWMAWIGDVYYAEAREEEAKKIYYQTKNRYPKSEGEILARSGILDIRSTKKVKGNYEKVLKGFNQLLEDTEGGPYHDIALMRKAAMLDRQGRYPESIEVSQQFFEKYPESLYRKKALYVFQSALISQVRLSHKEKNDLNVIELAQKYRSYVFDEELELKDEWEIVTSHRRASFLYTALGLLEDLKKKNVREDTLLYRKAELYLDLGEFERALEVLNDLKERFPKSTHQVDVYALFAKEAYETRDYQRAIENGRLAFEKGTPERIVEVYYILGSAYWMLGDLQKALNAFQSALNFKSGHDGNGSTASVLETVRYGLGDLFYDLGRYKEALAAYENAVSLLPKDRNVNWGRYRIGLSQMHLGRLEPALETLKGIKAVTEERLLSLLIKVAVEEVVWKQEL